jgi:hypothetical protein
VELGAAGQPANQVRLMAAITQFYMIDEVARMLGEDPEMLEEIGSNDDNLSCGSIASAHTRTDEAITAVTGHRIGELREMILNARRSPQEWHNFLEDFVSDPNVIARVKDKGPQSQPSGYDPASHQALKGLPVTR